MGVKVEIEECSECTGTGYCSLCLNSGVMLDHAKIYVECTRCNWENPGKCSWCKGKGNIENITKTDDKNTINLDFSKNLDEDYEVSR